MKYLLKMLSMVIVISMLLLITSVTALADEPRIPTIDEILYDYHSDAFNQRTLDADCSRSTLSHRSSNNEKTLEQETVDILNYYGYEAYNLTASNYDHLQSTLQTDLSVFGLNPNGSYVVTISGEEPSPTENPNARVVLPPSDDYFDGDSSSSFGYIHNGVHYIMRYVTITSATEPCLFVSTEYRFSSFPGITDYIDDILTASLSMQLDKLTQPIPIGTILSLLGDWTPSDELTLMNPGDVTIYAGTAWTRNYIQIWDADNNVWHTAQCSAYAITKTRCIGGYVYNATTNSPEFAVGQEKTKTTYSAKYHNYEVRKAEAVQAYGYGTKYHDCTGDISFFFVSAGGDINFTGNDTPLFTHNETSAYLLPLIDGG